MHDVYENRVRFAETDQQGVVFYGEYVTFQDETVNAFLRAIGYDYDTMRAADWDVHVAHVDLDYRAPARFEDVVVNACRVEAIGESSVRFAYRARRKRDGATLAEGHVVHVAVDADGSTRVPEAFRDAVVVFQDDPPEQ
ncbi:acyl-CoA thioesterase [Halomarina ordinaria]|uniref:Acyl-CoA thioesterase n=1 Tax=Halomarina ordinaria TaxID=3033939 RepID=A0ABD5U946_9EURY|nr:thioesterase family protein [Halomarina sp. PSRA2]